MPIWKHFLADKNAEFSLILRIIVYKLSRHCISFVADATFVVCINGGNAADNTATISFIVEIESSTLVFWDKFICNDFYFKPVLPFNLPFLLNKKIHIQGNWRILNLTKQISFSNTLNLKFYTSWLLLSIRDIVLYKIIFLINDINFLYTRAIFYHRNKFSRIKTISRVRR